MASTVKTSNDEYILFTTNHKLEILTKTQLQLVNWRVPLGSWLYVPYMDEWMLRAMTQPVNLKGNETEKKHPYPAWKSREPEQVPEQYKLQLLLLSQ